MKRIYLDYAATTPVDPLVLEAMQPYFNVNFGNPNSVHYYGREAQAACDEAIEKIALFLNADINSIIFTSGATESNNLAIFGLVGRLGLKSGHIISSAFEHPSVFQAIKKLQGRGFSVTFIKPNNLGLLPAEEFIKAIRSDTFLVSCMYVNNEIGTIQPVSEIGKELQYINKKRAQRIYFHSDAVQAAPFLPIKVDELGVDFLTLSAHKIYGPKGVGVLYVKNKSFFDPLFYGGEQQSGLRPGTINVPGLVGLGKAAEILLSEIYNKDKNRIKNIQLDLWNRLNKSIPGVSLNGSLEKRVPGNLNVRFSGIAAESLVILLDQAGLAVSRGSACAAGAVSPSRALASLDLTEEENISSIRISLGRFSRLEDNEYITKILVAAVRQLRKSR